jgi:hypothetical protein
MPERVLPREFKMPPEYIVPLSNLELQELGVRGNMVPVGLDFLMIYCQDRRRCRAVRRRDLRGVRPTAFGLRQDWQAHGRR